MSDRKARLYEMGGRVQTFGKDNTADSAMDSDDQEGVASTVAVGRLIKSGMAEVTQLDAIVNNKYARNPEKLRAWESASHIERAPKRERNPHPAPPLRPRRRSSRHCTMITMCKREALAELRRGSSDANLQRTFIEADLVDSMVALPDQFF